MGHSLVESFVQRPWALELLAPGLGPRLEAATGELMLMQRLQSAGSFRATQCACRMPQTILGIKYGSSEIY